MRKRNGAPVSAVVDTNLLVSGLISRPGAPYELVERLRRGAFTLLASSEVLAEYRYVLSRPSFAQKYGIAAAEVAAFLFLLNAIARRVTPRRRLPVRARDRKDEKILAAALGGRANYLVTGDDDLLVLRGHPKLGSLRIVTVKEFLSILDG